MAGSSGLFLKDGGTLTPLVEEAYDAEAILQELLATHPELLPGEAMDPVDPRRFMLVRREAPVAGNKLDHLFIDHDAMPTRSIHVARSRSTRTMAARSSAIPAPEREEVASTSG